MPFCKILCDLKLAAVKLYQGHHLHLNDILDCLRMSKDVQSMFYHVLALLNATGDIVWHTFDICGHPWILQHTTPQFIRNSFVQMFLQRNWRWLQQKGMRTYGWTSYDTWPNMNLNNSAFLMNIQRTRGPLASDMDNQGKAHMLWRKVYSFMGAVFWLKDYSQLMGWSQTLLLRALWHAFIFFNIWSSKWCCIVISPYICMTNLAFNGSCPYHHHFLVFLACS